MKTCMRLKVMGPGQDTYLKLGEDRLTKGAWKTEDGG